MLIFDDLGLHGLPCLRNTGCFVKLPAINSYQKFINLEPARPVVFNLGVAKVIFGGFANRCTQLYYICFIQVLDGVTGL